MLITNTHSGGNSIMGGGGGRKGNRENKHNCHFYAEIVIWSNFNTFVIIIMTREGELGRIFFWGGGYHSWHRRMPMAVPPLNTQDKIKEILPRGPVSLHPEYFRPSLGHFKYKVGLLDFPVEGEYVYLSFLNISFICPTFLMHLYNLFVLSLVLPFSIFICPLFLFCFVLFCLFVCFVLLFS